MQSTEVTANLDTGQPKMRHRQQNIEADLHLLIVFLVVLQSFVVICDHHSAAFFIILLRIQNLHKQLQLYLCISAHYVAKHHKKNQ